ncbi:hypothetical protein MRB53_025288 [Persea americana]|uniref:Uncharacterized protein n=1 Tax=Persea americana TaxID=3435 RepID=A0ACC2LFS8_PERAE|nr:hypothetical protein MRB53_025288 [Persea americana]
MVDGYCVNSDSSELYSLDEGTNSENGTDGSYQLSNDSSVEDDDALYEAAVDLEVEFIGIRNEDEYRGQGKVRLRQHQRIILGKCAMLWDYCEELKRTNLGSTVVMKIAPVGDVSGLFRFKRIYICFEALKKGFSEYCRLVIGLDGCHLTDSTKVTPSQLRPTLPSSSVSGIGRSAVSLGPPLPGHILVGPVQGGPPPPGQITVGPVPRAPHPPAHIPVGPVPRAPHPPAHIPYTFNSKGSCSNTQRSISHYKFNGVYSSSSTSTTVNVASQVQQPRGA